MSQAPNTRSIFSIIEIVVVIALLWFVTAIVFPTFSWRRRRREAFARAEQTNQLEL